MDGIRLGVTWGVDPGLDGACVVLFDGVPQRNLVVRARKYAVETTSFAKNRLEIEALYDDLQNTKSVRGAVVYMESPVITFGKSAVTSASQNQTYGKFEAVFTMLGAEQIIEVTPSAWKTKYGLLKTKKRASCDRVRELFPEFDLLVKDADIAEALLIGRYGYRYIRGEE